MLQEPGHNKAYKMTGAHSKDTDQPAHPRESDQAHKMLWVAKDAQPFQKGRTYHNQTVCRCAVFTECKHYTAGFAVQAYIIEYSWNLPCFTSVVPLG